MASTDLEKSEKKEKKFEEMLKEYDPPNVDISVEESLKLKFTVRTADTAQQMYLSGELDEEQFAKAVRLFGKPSNPSERLNRADYTYERKLPKWAFSPPEGRDRSMDEKIEMANEKHPYNPDAPMTLEQRSMWPAQAREWDKEHKEKKNG